MQKLIYPTKIMGLTQNYNMGSHYAASHGKPCSYPIDDACNDKGREWFYAPCDVAIKRIYGVNNRGANSIWMQSTEKVKLANGKENYVTIRVTHPEDDDLSKIKLGQIFKQYEKMFREGGDGGGNIRYGNHFHIETSTCKFFELQNDGWIKNSKGSWVTTPSVIKPEDAYFVDKSFTKIKNTQGLKFKELPIEPEPSKNQTLYLPASALKWRVYKLNVVPKVGNECGYLYPHKFGGLTYDILRWTKYKDVCVIKTRDFGEVQIYVAASTGAIIK